MLVRRTPIKHRCVARAGGSRDQVCGRQVAQRVCGRRTAASWLVQLKLECQALAQGTKLLRTLADATSQHSSSMMQRSAFVHDTLRFILVHLRVEKPTITTLQCQSPSHIAKDAGST